MRGQGFSFVAPLLVLMFVAFNAPIVYMLGLAFWEKGRGLTLEHYEGLIETPVYLKVLGNTMRIALIATLANVVLGYPLAHWMRGLGGRGRMIAIALVVLPFWVSILVRTYAWIVVLGNGGLVNRALQWTGLTDAPVSFLYNELGVTIGMANVLLPFLVLPLYAAMIRIDDRPLQAAAPNENPYDLSARDRSSARMQNTRGQDLIPAQTIRRSPGLVSAFPVSDRPL